MDLNIYNIHLMVALFGKPLKVNYMANIEKILIHQESLHWIMVISKLS